MYRRIKILTYDCKCERCGHKWMAYEKLPIACAKCKTKSWKTKSKEK